jgi:hypothetical protein
MARPMPRPPPVMSTRLMAETVRARTGARAGPARPAL